MSVFNCSISAHSSAACDGGLAMREMALWGRARRSSPSSESAFVVGRGLGKKIVAGETALGGGRIPWPLPGEGCGWGGC
jgi:hypothetical protein